MMAKEIGISASSVQRIWHAHGLQPHRFRRFKLSNDPNFVEKLHAAHKHPKVRAWLDRHERFVFHLTPTSRSWLNAVEGYFAKLSKQRLKRGVSDPSSISRKPSIDTSPKQTRRHSPSHGPRTRTKSSPPSNAGTKC